MVAHQILVYVVRIHNGHMEITQQGKIRVGSIERVVDHDNVKIYHIDLTSKYPEDIWDMGTDDKTIISITASPRTLLIDEEAESEFTEITFDEGGDWVCLTDKGKYTVYVIFFKYPEYIED